MDELRFVLF